jgi:hypothetical protein
MAVKFEREGRLKVERTTLMRVSDVARVLGCELASYSPARWFWVQPFNVRENGRSFDLTP